ncbi:hypothetical protein MYCTH_2110729 [Thermothelomyces thermophilus ATCC 42464]|uniref:Glucose-methanol-choline oxidoreductase N-terminal domain-containing protein n=1 Tax=Thermothelomyces thermophilus (strain ATCC 42464 / BCRC 31852 / DSM 1799) TaxID=573729 RepID=G2QE00_THET4|nr:uncharacterized protein MYCTH_2110729 [Thermothelomyces thermophilus ATCC 42464]AEO58409.1 hypothetical protein MYCTH_2110729 [Thermothelomyces thermophilus ATCC 42464]
MLPFVIKSSTLAPPDWEKRGAPNATFVFDRTVFYVHSSSYGPLQVSYYSKRVHPTNTSFAEALRTIDLRPSRSGFNGGLLSGSAYTTETIHPASATRSSSHTSYLTCAIQNIQLKVYNMALASKILFRGDKETGVTVSTEGTSLYTLTATKEVVLFAGMFHSPQLLMLSGVGPRPLLDSLRIPVISDLPGVGQHLQDPIFISVQSGVKTPSLASELADPNRLGPNLTAYINKKAGPYSSAGGYIAFEKLPAASRAVFSARTRDGSPTLRTPSSWKVVPEVTPGRSVETDEQILDYIQNKAMQMWHASATDAMGNDPANGTVVDWRAKVFGVDGLRVVDASALPFALPGHPQVTIYAFAEEIAALILEDIKQ